MVKESETDVSIAVSDPTQKQSTVTLELNKAGLSLVSSDNTVTIVQTLPTVKLQVNVAGSVGKTHVVTFKKDTTAPVITPTVSMAVYWTTGGSLNFDISDSESGVAEKSLTLDGSEVSLPYTFSPLSLNIGNHSVLVTATDTAGNETRSIYTLNVVMDAAHLNDLVTYAYQQGWITN
ncbi:Xanthan lyase precursor [compost metagenome]